MDKRVLVIQCIVQVFDAVASRVVAAKCEV